MPNPRRLKSFFPLALAAILVTGLVAGSERAHAQGDCLTGTEENFSVDTAAQTYQVDFAGPVVVSIYARGGAGGSNTSFTGGFGAVVVAHVPLTGPATLEIIVGEGGDDAPLAGAGGGGGSFVYDTDGDVLLVAAGGGGGAGATQDGQDAQTGEDGGDTAGDGGLGGTNGLGGGAADSLNGGAGGAGFLSQGGSVVGGATGGSLISPPGSAAGGVGYVLGGGGDGGFGGGGGGGGAGGGGGGGYSGGGGAYGPGIDGGGGGGSFASAAADVEGITHDDDDLGPDGQIGICVSSATSSVLEIPTLGGLGAGALALVLAGAAMVALRRRSVRREA